MNLKVHSLSRQGFTLIELSIVLVIIGLIVGGILVGQDMIHAATIRAQITQLEKYNTAVHTFQGKYNALPGDINAAAASQFGFAARVGVVGRGDGNGLIEGSTGGGSLPCAETVLFWNDLGKAQLIEGQFVGGDGDSSAPSCTASSVSTPTSSILPPAKIGRLSYVIVYAAGGVNYFQLLGQLTPTTGVTDEGWVGTSGGVYSSVTPQEAFSIDVKLDDGLPLTGQVQGVNEDIANVTPVTLVTPGAASTDCASSATTPATYNVGAGRDNLVCSLRERFN